MKSQINQVGYPGSKQPSTTPSAAFKQHEFSAPASSVNPKQTGDLLHSLGMHPGGVCILVGSDCMGSVFDTVTLGLGAPLTFMLSFGIGALIYWLQREKCGDSHGLAAAKALIGWILFIAPTPIPGLLTLGPGLAGLIDSKKQ